MSFVFFFAKITIESVADQFLKMNSEHSFIQKLNEL